LRPGGKLFLSTKNRFALKYLTGAEDEHLGMRFGSALPRWVQRRVANKAGRQHPGGHLHSWNELKIYLTIAGFNKLIPLFAFPDARYPLFLGELQDFSKSNLSPSEVMKLSKRDRLLARLPGQLRVAFSNSIIYLAEK
jgi:hypothetical protein